MDSTSPDFSRIRDLYLQGLYQQAWEAGKAFGPLRSWSGPAGRLIAGRLAMQLGSHRLARQLHLLAYRESPAYPEAIYYFARYLLERFGPYSCRRFMLQHTDWSDSTPDLRADWLSLAAFVAARFQDYERADKLLAQADAVVSDRAWLHVERSSILLMQDRLEEANSAANRSLELQPWFRPGVQAVAHILLHRRQEEEAVAFLKEANQHIECGAAVAHLLTLHYDRGEYDAAQQCLNRYAELSPMRDDEANKWISARQADLAYHTGEKVAAIEYARAVGEEFYTLAADRIEAATTLPQTHLLEVRPAESSETTPSEQLTAFWKQPLPIPPKRASDSQANGLPNADARRQFQNAGWTTRAFSLTLEIAAALIDRGLPFFVTLADMGHLQTRLVVGVDRLRDSLYLVDEDRLHPVEAPLATMRKRCRLYGPHAWVAVPPDQARRLDELTFPEVELHDRLHELQTELLDHRFPLAKKVLEAMQSGHPNHHLTHVAALAWAKGIGHTAMTLDALNTLLLDFPHEPVLVMAKAGALRELGRMEERLALLQEEGNRLDAEPLLVQSLAQQFLTDPAKQLEADRLIRRSLRNRPQAAPGYFLLAIQHCDSGAFREGAELHRIATCLDELEMQFADAYMRTARAADLSTEPLRFFQQRSTRAAVPSVNATKALFQALWDRDEPEQAFLALNTVIETCRSGADRADLDPKLGDLLLFRAEMHANFSHFAEAEADLQAAEPLAPPVVWHRVAASVARTKPDFHAAVKHLREVVKLDPCSADQHRPLVSLLSDTEGRQVAKRHLAEVVQRYPQCYPLLRLRAEFLAAESDESPILATQDLLELYPRDAWAFRQLALLYVDRRRFEDAFRACENAAAIEPDHPSQFAVTAHVQHKAEHIEEAAATLKRSLAHDLDHELAIYELVQLCPEKAEKKAALRYVAERLHTQPHAGEGLLAYYDQSIRLIDDPEEAERFLAELEGFLDERPDLWQAWSVVVQQLALSLRAEEAVTLARQATERFPLVPRTWIDLAEAYRAADQLDDRLEALRQAVTVAPNWVPAVRELSAALAQADLQDEATKVLQRLVPRAPTDPLAHWALAERLWECDRGREALEEAKRSVRLDLGYDPRAEIAWSASNAWAERIDEPHEALELARELTRDRAGDPRAWLRLARGLYEPYQVQESLAAIEEAIRLDPRNVDAFNLKAERLASQARFEEALAATKPPELEDDWPIPLQGRAAWVEALRGNFAAAIPPMQALVAKDPDYAWGWQQLAEWYNETGRAENSLEAASELVRLRPESPLPLKMRGEAKIKAGDRDGGKADLRESLRIHPAFSPAAAVLFDACLADGETREARSALAVLQEHLTGPEVLIKQLQFATRSHDESAALRTFTEICETPGDAPSFVLQMALIEMQNAGLNEQTVPILRRTWEAEEPYHPWVPIFWLETTDAETADLSTRLAACDSVLKQYPRFVPAYDRKAELLAGAGRFEDALAACAPESLGDDIPLPLRGRAAWVEAQRGNRDAAITAMRELVTEAPDYSWGWRQLTFWYDAHQQQRDFLHAADQLVRSSPNDPMALAIRGEAKRSQGDHAGAKQDFGRAFELDDTFDAAGLQLVAAQIQTNDLNAAESTLAKLRSLRDGPLVKLRAVQLASRMGQLQTARNSFFALLTDSDAIRSVLRDAVHAMSDAGWVAEADEELNDAVTEGDAQDEAAGLWVERQMLVRKPWEVADRLAEVVKQNRSAGREAVLTYVAIMADNRVSDSVAGTIQLHAEVLQEDDTAWARAGAALVESRNYALAAAWLNNWKDRAELEPWMLRALGEALRAIGEDDDAEALMLAVAESAPPAQLPIEFPIWLAIHAGVEGRTDDAVAWMNKIIPTNLTSELLFIQTLAQSLIEIQNAARPQKAGIFAGMKEKIRETSAACPPNTISPGTVRWYLRVVDRLAADSGLLAAKMWAWWQRLRPWLKSE